MEDFDYYEILEIERTSDKEVIKKAYRKLALKYHPDRNPNDKQAEEIFKKVNEAYQILSDDEKRQIYDRYGKKGLEQNGMSSSGFSDFGSFFEDLFGQAFGFGTRSRTKGSSEKYESDFLARLDLSFKEAVFGCKKQVKNTYKKPCSSCKGNGCENGAPQTCPDCQGQGQVFIRQGFMTFGQTCPRCKGEGSIITNPCKACKGNGFVTAEESFDVDVPAGVDNEMRLRVSKRGNELKNGARGDLYLVIYVQDDEHFIRNGTDIYIEIPVFFTQILLGAKIDIPSLTGKKLELNLPPNSKDKEQFVFHNEGVADVNTKRKGRLIAQISITYPTNLNAKQKSLLEELDKSFGIHSKPYENIFQEAFEKIKEWFNDKKKG